MRLYCLLKSLTWAPILNLISSTLNSSANGLSPPLSVSRLAPVRKSALLHSKNIGRVTGTRATGFPTLAGDAAGTLPLGTGVTYQPWSQLRVLYRGFHHFFSLDFFLSKVFAFKQEFASLLIISPFESIAKAARVACMVVSAWAPWQQPGVEWCEPHLFPFADTVHRVGTFRRKFKEVKTELFVTSGSQEPALKTSGESAVDTICQEKKFPRVMF